MSPRRSAPKSEQTNGAPAQPGNGSGQPSEAGGAGPVGGWVPRDLFVPYILLAVSLQRAHGYLIEEYLRSLGFVGLEMSTLYRTLRQLEKDGLLFSTWEPGATGPARRVYSLTDAGRAWLDTWAAALELYQGMIERFFALYTGGRPTGENPARDEPRGEEDQGP